MMSAPASGSAFWQWYVAAPEVSRTTTPTLDSPVGQFVTQAQIESERAAAWRSALGLSPAARLHRSEWEQVYILQALDRFGMLQPGRRGIVLQGERALPLPYAIARRGVDVGVMTVRRGPFSRGALEGEATWAPALASDCFAAVCPPPTYAERARYRQIVSGPMPADVVAERYDFLCTNELIRGADSFDAAIDFLPELYRAVRPGGVIVLVSDAAIGDVDPEFAHRKKLLTAKDLVRLQKRLSDRGWAMRLNLHPGDGPGDTRVDEPPYQAGAPHLKVKIGQFVVTSVGLVLARADQAPPAIAHEPRSISWRASGPLPHDRVWPRRPATPAEARAAYAAAPKVDDRVPPSLVRPVSQLCTQAQIESTIGTRWRTKLDILESWPLHRKIWEYLFVLETLDQFGQLGPGKKGLGFGVGQEVLPYYFASVGVDLLATDLAMESVDRSAWVDTKQHGSGLVPHQFPRVCDPQLFCERVSYRDVDMNAIPEDLSRGAFDFCYSCCSLEHVGSIGQGLDFILNSTKCLNPGGVAVHTTEFNLSSDTETVEAGETVLFRRRDMLELQRRAEEMGLVLRLNLHPGDSPVDRYIDVPPFSRNRIHLKLELGNFFTTSIGLILCRPPETAGG